MKEFKGTKEKIHAIEYAGIIFMQDSEFYEDQEECNILNMDYVGREVAEANGKLFETAPEMLELLKYILINPNISHDDLISIEFLINKATTI